MFRRNQRRKLRFIEFSSTFQIQRTNYPNSLCKRLQNFSLVSKVSRERFIGQSIIYSISRQLQQLQFVLPLFRRVRSIQRPNIPSRYTLIHRCLVLPSTSSSFESQREISLEFDRLVILSKLTLLLLDF